MNKSVPNDLLKVGMQMALPFGKTAEIQSVRVGTAYVTLVVQVFHMQNGKRVIMDKPVKTRVTKLGETVIVVKD